MKKVIIIGSGIGGLTAGNLLAKSGHQVTVFETHNMPGGYTAGFYRRGYYFESGTFSLEASATVFKAMKDIGVFEKIDFLKQRLRFVTEDFDEAPENYDEYKRMIYNGFPFHQQILDLVFRELEKMANLKGRVDERYLNMTTSEFAARYFAKGSKLYHLFIGFGYPNMPAYYIGETLYWMFNDYWTVKSGMQFWADTLAHNFRKLGGNLQLSSHVDKIIISNGTAVGVSCKDTVYDADYVISAGDYKKTFLQLLDDKSLISQELRDRISQADVSESFFTVYLGLKMSNEELGQYMKVPYVCTFDNKTADASENFPEEKYFSRAAVSFYSPSMVNPQHAPDGKSSLMLQTMAPCRWMNNWGGGDKEEYRRLKEKAMAEMINGASRLISGLADRIEYKDAATPLTYERITGNSDGATSGWSWNPKKKFYKNIMSVNIITPVKNLYIGSCWATQRGGVPSAIAAAYRCAQKIT